MNIRQGLSRIRSFWRNETGLELSEYAVATALISLAVAGAMTNLGTKIKDAINALESKMTTS